jgi:hypothetical protein
MKRLLTGFTITLVAAVWMIGSWCFFNSIAVGTLGSVTMLLTLTQTPYLNSPN